MTLRHTIARLVLTVTFVVAACTDGAGRDGAPTTAATGTTGTAASGPAPTSATTGSDTGTDTGDDGHRAVLEDAAAAATGYFAARGVYDWEAAGAATTGAAARFVEHLSVSHLVAGSTAPLPERPTVEADLAGAERDGAEVAVAGTVTVTWSDGREEAFDGLRFTDTGGRLLLADYANAAGPLSDHLVDGHAVAPGRAGPVGVALVAAVWLAPEPVVALTLRLANGGDAPARLAEGGVTVEPAGGGPPVSAVRRWDVAAPPGADGWALAELAGDDLPVRGGRLLVAVADDRGRPLGTAAVDLPPFPAAGE